MFSTRSRLSLHFAVLQLVFGFGLLNLGDLGPSFTSRLAADLEFGFGLLEGTIDFVLARSIKSK